MKEYPVLIEIHEIAKYMDSQENYIDKISFLENLRWQLCLLCYNLNDYEISKYLKKFISKKKVHRHKYNPSNDFVASHISTSEYVYFLNYIDKEILPFVRIQIMNISDVYKEDNSIVNQDYPTYHFNTEKILKYAKVLDSGRAVYLKWIVEEYDRFMSAKISKIVPEMNMVKIGNMNYLGRSAKKDFRNKLNEGIKKEKAFFLPDAKNSYEMNSEIRYNTCNFLFKRNTFLFSFNFTAVIKHCSTLGSINLSIKYLEFIKKQANIYQKLFKSYIEFNTFNVKIENEIDLFSRTKIKGIEVLKKKAKIKNNLVIKKKTINNQSSKTLMKSEKVILNVSKKNLNPKKEKSSKSNLLKESSAKKLKKNDNSKIENDNLTVSVKKGSNDKGAIKNSEKLRWIGSKNQLDTLLYQLQDNDFFENNLNDDNHLSQYLPLFVDNGFKSFTENKAKKVKWKSEISELAYLIGELSKSRTKSLIHGTKKWVKASKVFFNQYGDDITPATLSSSYGKKTITANQEVLDRIIKDVYKSS